MSVKGETKTNVTKLENEVVLNEVDTALVEKEETKKAERAAKVKKILKIAGVAAVGVAGFFLGTKAGSKSEYAEYEVIDVECEPVESDAE